MTECLPSSWCGIFLLTFQYSLVPIFIRLTAATFSLWKAWTTSVEKKMQGHVTLEVAFVRRKVWIFHIHFVCLFLWVFCVWWQPSLITAGLFKGVCVCVWLFFSWCCVWTILSLSIPQVFHLPLDVSVVGRLQGCRDGLYCLCVHQPLHHYQHHPVHLHPVLHESNFNK